MILDLCVTTSSANEDSGDIFVNVHFVNVEM